MPNWNFPKVQAGDPLSRITNAAYHNALRDSLRWTDAARNKAGAGKPLQTFEEPDIVWITNNTDDTLNAYDVVGIDDTPITATDNITSFLRDSAVNASTPDLSKHLNRFAIVTEPLLKTQTGVAQIGGICPVLVKKVYDWHKFARLDDGEAKALVSDTGGVPILWMDTEVYDSDSETGDEYYWALVLLGYTSADLGVWKNTGSSSVGIHGAARIDGVDTSTADNPIATAQQASSTFGTEYLINGSTEVAQNKYGVYQKGSEVAVAYDDSASPANGDEYGPKADHWGVYAGYPSTCTCLGVIDSTNKIMLARLHAIGKESPFYNDSGESIPAYAIMRITGLHKSDSGESIIKVGKPSSGSLKGGSYIVNGSLSVDSESTGFYQRGREVKILYGSDSPTIGDEIGPCVGQWYVNKWYSDLSSSCPLVGVCVGIDDEANKVMRVQLHDYELVHFGVLSRTFLPGMQETPDASYDNGDSGPHVTLVNYTPESGESLSDIQVNNLNMQLGLGWYGRPVLLLRCRPGEQTNGNVDSGLQPYIVISGEFSQTCFGKTKASIAKESSGNVEVYLNGYANATGSGKTVSAYNHSDATIDSDTIVTLNFSGEGYWWIGACSGGGVQFGKVQASPSNGDGIEKRQFSIVSCDIDGSNETGDAITVYSPIKPRAYTDLKDGDVVGYATDPDGNNIITTDCWQSDNRINGTLSADIDGTVENITVALVGSAIGVPPTSPVTVYNILGLIGTSGSPCKIEYNIKESRWELVAVQQQSDRRINGILSDAISESVGSVSVELVGAVIGNAPESPVTAYNLLKLSGLKDDPCKVEYNVNESRWELVSVPHDAKVRVSSSDDTPGFLSAKLEGDRATASDNDKWVTTATANEDTANSNDLILKVKHTTTDDEANWSDPEAILTNSFTGGTNEAILSIQPDKLRLDKMRHVVAHPSDTDNQIDVTLKGDGSWVTTDTTATNNTGTITVAHTVTNDETKWQAAGDAMASVSVSGGQNSATITAKAKAVRLDNMRHVVGTPDSSTTTISVAGDGDWLTVAVNGDDITVEHSGPTLANTSYTPLTVSEDGKTITQTPITFDEHGHATAIGTPTEVNFTDKKVAVSATDTGGYLGAKLVGDNAWVEVDTGDSQCTVKHINSIRSGNAGVDAVFSPTAIDINMSNQLEISRDAISVDETGHTDYKLDEESTPLTLQLVEVTLTESRYVAGTGFQTRTHSVWVLKDGTTSDWSTVIGVASC